MRRRLASPRLILCLLLFAAPTELHAQDEPRCFMWKISSPTTTVYLLGSVHMARQKLYPLDRAIEDAFAQSEHLVVELDTA